MAAAPAPLLATQPLRFGADGRFELRPAERRLLVDGQAAALGARAFDLLIALVERRDRVVTKNELLDCVWPDVVVEEQNLHVQISHLRKVFGKDVLSTVPGRGYRFTAPTVEFGAPPATASAATPASPPPAPPRLFGRADDLATLDALLQQGSVTLVGPSGVGKTTLARAAAARWAGSQAWIDLAALSDGAQIAGAVARALGAQLGEGDPLPQLLRVAGVLPSLLLVLDNAEHLIEPCAALTGALIRGLPEARLLVTSQLPLAVAGEQVQRLEPLKVDAVELLVERIGAADQRFRVTSASHGLLEAVCTQLDGLPLALEMAAARVPQIGLQAVHDALSQRFALLTRGKRDAAQRHRTLHRALEWSYQLLGAPEQTLFRALGVFAGGFTLELAVALMAGDGDDSRWDVIDRLATLVDRSLVAASADDPPRYRLLETMRAFSLEQALHAQELDAARRRHAAALFGHFQACLGPGTIAATPHYLAEMENAREACAWAREHDLPQAALLAAAVVRVTTFSVWRSETKRWLEALEPAMDSEAGAALPLEVQCPWWSERARVALLAGEQASAAAERAMALARRLGDPLWTLRAAVVRVRATPLGAALDEACAELRAFGERFPEAPVGQRLMIQGALTQADMRRRDRVAVLEGRRLELALAREQGNPAVIDAVESNVVVALSAVGRHAEAADTALALLARIEQAPDGQNNGNLPWVYAGAIDGLVACERLDEARALAERAWAAGARLDAPHVVRVQHVNLAVACGRHEVGAQLIGHLRQLHEARGIVVDPADAEVLADAFARVVATLGAARTDVLVAAGRALDDAAARSLAVTG